LLCARPARKDSAPAGMVAWLGRTVLSVHRGVLRLYFGLAGMAERIRQTDPAQALRPPRRGLSRLVATYGGGEETPGDARGLIGSEELEEGLRDARHHDLDLLLLRQLKQEGFVASGKRPEAQRRRQEALALRTLLWRTRLEEIVSSLRQRSIAVMALKGFAHSLTTYRDDIVREMKDVDLLIHPGDSEEALRWLEHRGFLASPGRSGIDYRVHHHAVPLEDPETGLLVEIHTDLTSFGRLPAGDAPKIWKRSEPLEFAGGVIHVPCREDRLIHACLHLTRDRYAGCLRDVVEIAEMVRLVEPPWNWGFLREIAGDRQCLGSLYVGLRLSRIICRAPVPEEFLLDVAPDLSPKRIAREIRIRFLASQIGVHPSRDGILSIAASRSICRRVAPL
jgi:Uncharacterised nucleotidyltransferase